MSEILKHKIRRDLNRWSRKLLLSIGLESIGRELVGVEKWEYIYPLQQVWHQEQTSDFDPTNAQVIEEAVKQEQLDETDPSDVVEEGPNEENSDYLDNIFPLLPYWFLINRAFGIAGTGNSIDEPAQSQSNGDLNPSNFGEVDAQRLLFSQSLDQLNHSNHVESTQGDERSLFPVRNQMLSFLNFRNTGQQLTNGIHENTNQNAAILPGIPHSIPLPDEPLDLTQKTKCATANKSCQRSCSKAESSVPGEISESIQSRTSKIITRTSQRTTGKGYTTEELEAALQDIQSGKLGTRRAAVRYGIPRSTLRNKVYKMGNRNNKPLTRQRMSTRRLGIKENDSCVRGSYSSVPGELSDSHQVLRLNLEPNIDFNPRFHPRQKGTNERILENTMAGDGMSREKKVLKEWLRTKLSRQNCGSELSNGNDHSIVNKNTQEDVSHEESSDDGNSDSSSKEQSCDVILKIPTLLNSRSNFRDHEKRSSIDYLRSWKRAHETIGSGCLSPCDSEVDSNNESQTKTSEISVPDAVNSVNLSSSQNSCNLSATDDLNERKSRPKRGKYRNYDRDALLKAVKAVQDGEMSVHRAGSYHGVPHSTLEYKVKERHLLRRPKRKAGISSPKSNQKSSPESSLSGSEVLTRRREEKSLNFVYPGESNCFPLPSDLRESLSRFLNINQVYSSPSSPEMLENVVSTNENEESNQNNSDRHESVTSIQLRSSCLLDLSKKS